MALERDQAVVVRWRRWSESSQIVTLFCRRLGMVQVVAKGAFRRTREGKSKFDGGLDLLQLGEVVISHRPERELQTLAEWSLTDGFLPLHDSLRAIYLGNHAAELLQVVFDAGDPQPRLFDRLTRLLSRLHSQQREEMALGFSVEVLRRGGYVPELGRCVISRQKVEGGPVWFSPSRGGVVLPEAATGVFDAMTLSYDGLRLLRGLERLLGQNTPQRLPRLDRAITDDLHAILIAHLSHALGRRLRTQRFVLPTAGLPEALEEAALRHGG